MPIHESANPSRFDEMARGPRPAGLLIILLSKRETTNEVVLATHKS
jgi:hypothetical protein